MDNRTEWGPSLPPQFPLFALPFRKSKTEIELKLK